MRGDDPHLSVMILKRVVVVLLLLLLLFGGTNLSELGTLFFGGKEGVGFRVCVYSEKTLRKKKKVFFGDDAEKKRARLLL